MWFAVCAQDTLLMPRLLQNVCIPVCTEIVLFFLHELYVVSALEQIIFDIYWLVTRREVKMA